MGFLNTLTYDQQGFSTVAGPGSAVGTLVLSNTATSRRNGVKVQTTGTANNIPAVYGCDLNNNAVFNEAGDGQNLACNWLSWKYLIAYLDWSALRPITEFEYEKTCRGPMASSAGEYAWGSNILLQATAGALNNAGQSSETSTAAGSGLCAYGSNNSAHGPLRCGFAATATTNRIQSGGSYYGVMDMTGNVAEQCLGGYNFNYSAFTTANGDGIVATTTGVANTAGWPATGGGPGGGIVRGGDWFSPSTAYLQTSDRAFMTDNSNQVPDYRVGGRGVRSW